VSGVGGGRQYNGRVYDPGTGFHDYGARMYWPEIGRFISADSFLGDPANPASLNRYSYVHNNPYKYTDPTGHFAFLAAIPAICAAGACEAIASAALWTAAAIGLVAVADVAVHTTGRPADAPSGSASPPGQAPVDVATSPPPPQAPVDPALLAIPASAAAAAATVTTMEASRPWIGGSGKPVSHTVKHPNRKAAQDAAQADTTKGKAPVHHKANPDTGAPPHYHPVDSGSDQQPVHHDYPKR
jgi:RHS repeat-associated protein